MKSGPMCKVLSIHLSSGFEKYLELKHLGQYLKLKENPSFELKEVIYIYICISIWYKIILYARSNITEGQEDFN